MPRLIPSAAILVLVCACSRAPQPPAPPAARAGAPASAVNAQLASATVGNVHLAATLVPLATLPEHAIAAYGIDRDDTSQLLMVSARDRNGDAIPVDGLTVTAQAGSLQDAPSPIQLRAIDTQGMTDFIGVVPVAPPTTLRVQVEARKGGSNATMTFSRDFYPPR